MRKLNFVVDADKCIHCGLCLKDCVRQIISWRDGLPVILPEREAECIGCQHCLAICPAAAVSILGFQPENSVATDVRKLPGAEQTDYLIRSRRTTRQYTADAVPAELIGSLMETLQYAPTGRNDLGLTFSLIDNRNDVISLLERIGELVDAQPASENPIMNFLRDTVAAYRNNGADYIFRGAPHVLLATADETSGCPSEDIVIALTTFSLAAESRGVGTTWCGYLKIAADCLPGLREAMGFQSGEYFYAILFGNPAVRYPRGVQRDGAQPVRRLAF